MNGVDCYGLVCLIYRQELGITLNSYDGIFVDQSALTMLKLAEEMNKERDNWLKGDTPQAFDMIQLRTGRHAFHVGIMIDDKWMMHIEDGIDSVIESIKSPIWANRIEWVYRCPM